LIENYEILEIKRFTSINSPFDQELYWECGHFIDFTKTAQVSLGNLSSENIPSTLKDCHITFLGFTSSKLNVLLPNSYPFKDFFLNHEQSRILEETSEFDR